MRVPLRPRNIKKLTPKIRTPKLKPRKAEIVVGIPTYNEAKNIEAVTKIIDAGLTKYFPDKRAVIVNVDSNSPDKTRKAFLNARTKTPKHCIAGPRGKGASLKELFEYFLDMETAEVLMIVDGDVETATVKWVRNLITPILKGFDHVFPLYKRNEYDAALTDHLAYPVLRGVLGIDIRQPLGAEVGLSRKAVDRIYNRTWSGKAQKYGIDIFMTLSSVFGELRIAQTDLGVKEHTLNEKPHLAHEEIAATLFEMLDENQQFWEGKLRVRKPPVFFRGTGAKPAVPITKVDYKRLRQLAASEFKKHRTDIRKVVGKEACDRLSKVFAKNSRTYLDTEEWMHIVFAFVRASGTSPARRAKMVHPIFLDRFLTLYKKYLDKDNRLLENEVVRQAETFYKERKALIAADED